MSRVFLINVEAPEIRVAEVRGGELFDFDLERDGRLLGNIYKGVIENVVPGMDAAFVDIGLSRNALLYVGDVIGGEKGGSISQFIKPRQEVLVQVARPPIGTKGARVTMRLSIPGRFCILVAGADTLGVSKRIASEEERGRLRRVAERLRPLDHGLIVRTEAEGASEAALSADLSNLLRQMHALTSHGRDATAPSLIHEDLGILGRVVRDRVSDDVSAIWIDNRAIYDLFLAQVKTFAPHLGGVVQPYVDPTPIFRKFGIQGDLERATGRVVPLGSGGSIVIDEAEALTAVDVNTGSNVSRKNLGETVLATNLEAVKEIARQLRLRDLGGIVVVDFIDMERTKDRVKVLNTFEAALKDDRNRSKIVQISPSGLVEMTRRREGQSLQKLLSEPCPHCEGTGFVLRAESVAIEARRHAREMLLKNPAAGVLVVLHPETACEFLGGNGVFLAELEAETGGQIRLRVEESFERDHVHFERIVPKVPLARDLMVGALVPVPKATRFFPGGEPRYFSAGGTLVALDNPPDGGEASAPILVEITEVGRHFSRGKTAGPGK